MKLSTIKISKSLLHQLNRLKVDLSEYYKIDCSSQKIIDTAVEMLLNLKLEEVAQLLKER